MKMSRFSRLLATCITLFSLLFTQLAVAAYACPDVVNANAAVSRLVIDPDMPGCQGMPLDHEAPTLCAAQRDNPPQSADTASAPSIAPFIQAALTVILVAGTGVQQFVSPSHGPQLTRTVAPPLIIRHCCFQI